MSRWGRTGRWTPDQRAAVQRFYTRYGTAMQVINTDHQRWKQREAARSTVELYPLIGLCRAAGLPEPCAEYEFHPVRKWRFDYAWPLQRIALEVDGGIWIQGRHNTGAGHKADMEKFTQAARFGWRILYFEPDELAHALPLLAEIMV